MENHYKKVSDMGPATSEIFRGHSDSDTIKQTYGESASLFADIIKAKLPDKDCEYSLLDIGSFKGELLSEILKSLPEYRFNVTVTDANPVAIAENVVTEKKFVADAESLPLGDTSIDVIIMRYVLQFNSLVAQEKIISEISRIVKKIAIIQHGGADSIDSDIWRSKVNQIFVNDELPQIKRSGMFWSSPDEIEVYMKDSDIRFERVSSRRIEDLAKVYIERYFLNEEQAILLRKILADKNYLIQTTWIIYPKSH